MSYNNIGLTTPRGSGTSGYVQRNLSHVQPRDSFNDRLADGGGSYSNRIQSHRKPDASILEHERKRRIENKCVELQLELEEEGKLDEAEIEKRVDDLRKSLMDEDMSRERGTLKPHETHELAAMKARENEKFRSAMGVNALYVEGEAFDKELQAERRLKAIEERQKAESERALRAAKMQEERALREKNRQDEIEKRRKEASEKDLNSRRDDSQRHQRQRNQTNRDFDRRGRARGQIDGDDGPDGSSRLIDRMQQSSEVDAQPPRRSGPESRMHPDRLSRIAPEDHRYQDRPPQISPRRERGVRRELRRSGDSYRPTSARRGLSPVRRSRSPSNSQSRSRSRSRSYSDSPPPRRRRRDRSSSPSSSESRSRSRSPPPRSRNRSQSLSQSPPRRRHSPSPEVQSRDRRRVRSPSHTSDKAYSPEPDHRRSRVRSLSRSRSPESDDSPPRHKRSKRSGTRSPPPGYRPYSRTSPPITAKPKSNANTPPSPPSSPPSRSEDGSMEMSDESGR